MDILGETKCFEDVRDTKETLKRNTIFFYTTSDYARSYSEGRRERKTMKSRLLVSNFKSLSACITLRTATVARGKVDLVCVYEEKL